MTAIDYTTTCHCGRPLHYADPATEMFVKEMVAKYGACIRISVDNRTFLVPRHFLALHGIKGNEVAELGFEEVKS